MRCVKNLDETGIRDGQMQRHARSHCDRATPNHWVHDAEPGKWRRRQKKSREGEEKKGQGQNETRSPVRRADVKDPDPDDGR
ncbi:hypothetical protein AB1N83_013555 [Pleurotus pulmonarius]